MCRTVKPNRMAKDIFVLKLQNTIFNQYVHFLSEGRKHDAGMLAVSGLLRDLERHAFSPTGNPVALYGDPAYPLKSSPCRAISHCRYHSPDGRV